MLTQATRVPVPVRGRPSVPRKKQAVAQRAVRRHTTRSSVRCLRSPSQAFGVREEQLSEDERGGWDDLSNFIADEDEVEESASSSSSSESGARGRKRKKAGKAKRRDSRRAKKRRRRRGGESSEDTPEEEEEGAAGDERGEGAAAAVGAVADADAALLEEEEEEPSGAPQLQQQLQRPQRGGRRVLSDDDDDAAPAAPRGGAAPKARTSHTRCHCVSCMCQRLWVSRRCVVLGPLLADFGCGVPAHCPDHGAAAGAGADH